MKRTLAPLCLFAIAVACARDPVTGERELVLVSEAQEVAMGREAAQRVDASMGLYPDDGLQAYVEELGQRMAAGSERRQLPWQFRVVDSPVVNAFALPGGYIYFTRGILAYINNEAALAAVMGHEIGHVTARHSVEQVSRQQLAGLGVGLGTVFFPEIRPFGDALGGGLGLLFLKFGRDAERESDRLGVRYALAQGYDAGEMADFFSVLGKLGGSERNIPSWASTHPDPEEREATILALAAELTAEAAMLITGDVGYLRQVDGLIFGENPREGFMDGRRFQHPELKFELEFPEGWRVQNSRQAVYSAPPDGSAAIRLTMSRVAEGTTPEGHARRFFRQNRIESGTGERFRAGSFSAYRAPFRVVTRSGEILGEAGFVSDGNAVYEILGFTRRNLFREYSRAFRETIVSFDRLRDRRALEIEPVRIRVYEVPRTMTFSEVLREFGALEEHRDDLFLMNDLEPGDEVSRGRLVKILKQGPN